MTAMPIEDTDLVVTEWLKRFAALSQGEHECARVVQAICDAVIQAIPPLGDDPAQVQQLAIAAENHWRGFLGALWHDDFEVNPTRATFDLTRGAARHGFPVYQIYKSYRASQRALWHEVTVLLTEQVNDVQLRHAILVELWARITDWIDATVDMARSAYTDECHEWAGAAEARRWETVRAILEGEDLDGDRATSLLGHPVSDHQTALVCWADAEVEDVAEAEAGLRALAAELARQIGGRGTITVVSSLRGLWAWIATPGRPDLDGIDLAVPTGLHLAIGEPSPGCIGMRRSFDEARAAQRLAMSGSNQPITRYRDVELACLATGAGSLETMRTVALRELGGLAGSDESARRLRETASTYLAHGSNVEATAATLVVHANTVRYRIRQVEEQIGHPLAERIAFVQIALQCMEVLGDGWLLPAHM